MIRDRPSRLLAIVAVSAAIAMAATQRAASAEDFSAVDDLMTRLMSAEHVPGAALALIKDGQIVLEKGYGFRDLSTRAPVTATTLFNIGSISKSFTALGVAQLVDRQQVDLDKPVTAYIPDLRLSNPQVQQTMTLRQLLSHTSGLPADEQWPPQVPPTREGIVAEFAGMPITARPGDEVSVLQPVHRARRLYPRAGHRPILGSLHAGAHLRTARHDHGRVRASRARAGDRPSATLSA